jgi:hypothetical protein
LLAAVTNSVVFLTALAMSWAMLSLFFSAKTRGVSYLEDLGIVNKRKNGRRYWYTGGWNLLAVFASIVGLVPRRHIGLLVVYYLI